MAIINATQENVKETIQEGLVLLDFWAPWCGPCKMISPILEEISEEYGDKVKVVKVNVDENQQAAAEFQVMSIPTLFFLQNGKEVDKVLGYRPKEALLEILEPLLG